MALHIVFVADFGGQIEVLDHLPGPRRLPDINGIPCFRSYHLTRVRVEAEDPPVLPDGDITEEQYREWRAILDPDAVKEESVDPDIVARRLGGLCVDVNLAAVDASPHGTLLEAVVTNVGPYPIGKVQVAWHGRWEQPSDTGEIGRGLHFVSVGQPPRQLLPGNSRKFALMKPQLQQGLSYAAALSPDQFYLAVSASLPDEEAVFEIAHVPGTQMGYMIELLEKFLRTEKPQSGTR